MDCSSLIADQETIELLRATEEAPLLGRTPLCSQTTGGEYQVDYYAKEDMPPISLKEYSYASIPKCYGLCNLISMEESGITALQNLDTLSLRGQGVLLAVIDTGIRYQDAAFQNRGGRTRIAAIWDQTAQGNPPEGFLYGREYVREEIDRALLADEPLTIVPEADENGHGTALASIAAGSADAADAFTGAAPDAGLLIVKLKPAKRYLREFFYVPEEADAYSEADLLTALHYVNVRAKTLGLPVVICIGLGSSSGGRTGSGVFDDALNRIAALQQRAVVCATGNMANAGRHFLGRAESVINPVRAEINVEDDMDGLTAELWALAPERFSVEVLSPTGELLSRVISYGREDQEMDFLFEGTHLSVAYREAYRYGQNQLIFFRFTNLVRGIWTIRVYADVSIYGEFHIWLPEAELSMGRAVFLTPNPYTTLTTPADALIPMSVGGYDAQSGAVYLDSGRGYNAGGAIRPDFLAPAVRLSARGLRDQYITVTGTSGAAALTAGACAQLMEWAVTQENMPDISSVDIRNLLIRGCKRDANQEYPSPESGYGRLDVYQALENLRRK